MLQLHSADSKHYISFIGTAINCALTGEENLWAGCGIQENVWQCTTCITVLIYVDVWQFICEFCAIQLQIQVFLRVILHYYLWHTKLGWLFLHWFLGGMINKVETASHMLKHIFLCPLHSWALTLPRENACSSLSSNVPSHGSTMFSSSRKVVITWATDWPVCSLMHPHTCY
jgi:hypothetical protein